MLEEPEACDTATAVAIDSRLGWPLVSKSALNMQHRDAPGIGHQCGREQYRQPGSKIKDLRFHEKQVCFYLLILIVKHQSRIISNRNIPRAMFCAEYT